MQQPLGLGHYAVRGLGSTVDNSGIWGTIRKCRIVDRRLSVHYWPFRECSILEKLHAGIAAQHRWLSCGNPSIVHYPRVKDLKLNRMLVRSYAE